MVSYAVPCICLYNVCTDGFLWIFDFHIWPFDATCNSHDKSFLIPLCAFFKFLDDTMINTEKSSFSFFSLYKHSIPVILGVKYFCVVNSYCCILSNRNLPKIFSTFLIIITALKYNLVWVVLILTETSNLSNLHSNLLSQLQLYQLLWLRNYPSYCTICLVPVWDPVIFPSSRSFLLV